MTISEFENKWVRKIKDELLKSFPEDFLESDNCETLQLPCKPLLKGSKLFGSYEIIDTEGNLFTQVDSKNKMKYILYANYQQPPSTKMPTNDQEIMNSVKKYEKHLNEILIMIETEYKKQFRGENIFTSVSNRIFKLLNLARY